MAAIQGTRIIWKDSHSAAGATPQQILKNSGYISVVLQAVQYKAHGNFFQRLFSGSDKVTVSTQVNWQTPTDPKTAAAIQDFRKVSANTTNSLAIGRNVVLKVPAIADGLEMQVAITAIKDDNLGKTLQILNSDEFKQPLQLAPVMAGQILTVANLVKKAFSSTDPAQILTASYPAILSESAMADPVANNRLVEGYIIVIVKQDNEDVLDFAPDQLSVTGNGVTFQGAPIPNTCMVYNVTFEKWRGRDTNSSWSKQFDLASSTADELMFTPAEQKAQIVAAAYDSWKAGAALLNDDLNYTSDERARLKAASYQEVKTKISSNSAPAASPGSMLADTHSDTHLFRELLAPELFVSDHTEVSEYASELAHAGLPFGFSLQTSTAIQ